MYRFLPLLVLLLLTLGACNNNSSKKEQSATAQNESTDTYKRFTGTISGRQVIANINITRNTSDNSWSISGYYTFVGQGRLVSISGAGKDSILNATLHEFEESGTESEADETDYASWRITLANDRLTGTWLSADKKRITNIDLFEDYTGAEKLSYITGSDSVKVATGSSGSTMHIYYSLLTAAASSDPVTASAIDRIIIKGLGGDNTKAQTLYSYIKERTQADFAEYLSAMSAKEKNESSATDNWESAIVMTCQYNASKLLAIAIEQMAYTGGAHGISSSTHVIIDLDKNEEVKLTDILKMDTAIISAVLDSAARDLFKLAPGDSLSSLLLVNTIPPSPDFSIAPEGLLFYYQPYDIGPYSMGTICLYVPFVRLQGLVDPKFVARLTGIEAPNVPTADTGSAAVVE